MIAWFAEESAGDNWGTNLSASERRRAWRAWLACLQLGVCHTESVGSTVNRELRLIRGRTAS